LDCNLVFLIVLGVVNFIMFGVSSVISRATCYNPPCQAPAIRAPVVQPMQHKPVRAGVAAFKEVHEREIPG